MYFISIIKNLSKKEKIGIIAFVLISLLIPPVLFIFSRNQLSDKQDGIVVSPSPVQNTPGAILTTEPKITLSPYPSTPLNIKPSFMPDEIIVKYKSGQSPDEITNNEKRTKLNESLEKIGVISQQKLNQSSPVFKSYYLVKLKQGTDVLKAIELIKTIDEVEYAQPNYIQKTF
ncbi:MAG: hypothetical protein Q7K55_04375 [Candidatus Levybacteria bacterium]|nr:hypothetical protein [Candidatus Levybacteria bacterium]